MDEQKVSWGHSWWFYFLRGIEVTQNGFLSILGAAGAVWVLKNFESVSLRPKLYISEVKITQLCPTLCGSMDYTVGSLSPLQGIFPTQGLNPGLPHCRRILYQLSHKGSPRILEWVAYPCSCRSSPPGNRTGASCIAGGFFTNWAIREALKAIY